MREGILYCRNYLNVLGSVSYRHCASMGKYKDQEIVRKFVPRKQPIISKYLPLLRTSQRKNDFPNCSSFSEDPFGTKNYLLVRPKFESTPVRKKRKIEISDTQYDTVLIDGITPFKKNVCNGKFKVPNKNSITTIKSCSTSGKFQVFDNPQSRGILPDKSMPFNPPNQTEMLSLDESVLQSFDLERVEERYLDSDVASRKNDSKNCEAKCLSPDIFLANDAAENKILNVECSSDAESLKQHANILSQNKNLKKNCSKNLFNANSNADFPTVPSPIFKIPESVHNNIPKHKLDVTTDEFWNDLRAIDIDWNNDSMVANAMKEGSDDIQSSSVTASATPMGERIRKALMTNANRPVSNRSKSSEDTNISGEGTSVNISSFDIGPFFGLPSKVKELLKQFKGIDKLYEWQEECLNLKAIQERKNLVYALPTSGGKTLVAEILILRELLCYKRNAIFVLPYVSIVQEKIHSLSPFAVELGFLVEEYAAGKGQYPPRKRRRKQSVYVATIEKALGLINSLIETKRQSEIGLVVVDELHLVGDTNGRGATLEGFLTKLLFFPEKIHIIGMSATIGNLHEIAIFLHAEIYTQDFRPVELKEYIKCEDSMWAINWNAISEEDSLTLVRRLSYPYTPAMAKLDPDRVGGLVLEVVPDHSCLVFCPTKKNCENVALLICQIMPREILEYKRSEKEALYRALQSVGNGSVCSILKKCLPYGVVYHHSGLTLDERRLLEEAYCTGILCCICCTSTLAAGVNLPARRVILRSPYVARDFINLSRYKQMAGRAGRAGKGETGESILICKSSEITKVGHLLRSKMDDATSGMHLSNGQGIQALVLSAIGLGMATNRLALRDMVQRTLLAVQANRLNVSVKQLTDQAIVNLFKMKALQIVTNNKQPSPDSTVINDQTDISVNMSASTTDVHSPITPKANPLSSPVIERNGRKSVTLSNNTQFTVSRLGRAAMKAPIELSRAHVLYKDLLQAQASLVLLSCLHLLYLVTPYDLMPQIKPVSSVYFSVFNELDIKDAQTARVLGLREGNMLRMVKGHTIKSVPQEVVHRFYLTLMLNELWNQKSVWHVADKYQVPRGTVQNLMTSASSFAACVMRFCEELQEFWAFKDLLTNFCQRLSHCCTAELLPLMELPAVKRGRAKQLYNAGYKTLKDIANADAQSLVKDVDHMPKKVANQIIAAAKFPILIKGITRHLHNC
ncbi:helicase POLQ-like [Anabrus simplex]|uniref:helicase POLQ-like n=1 Tax=Anabrus simplex TaxID=316456 RepID=UPI0035A2CE7B